MKTIGQMKTILLAASAISISCAMPALAQNSVKQSDDAADDAASNNDILVTARRVEEKLQDVPISITVFTQELLTRNNVQTGKDIATYTPGLTTFNRNGENNTSFAIRGFTQERGTNATVGTYFADVVAPRGSGNQAGGDGAGPGSFFDLQNVQVLKGPQGTLQGRNSTGGAVLLVPRKPTDKLEGYVEVTAGAYSTRRLQGVLNLPVSDGFRLRLGLDRNKRDGYQKNIGHLGVGPNGKDMANRDYWALRASAVLDITPAFENYTIASYTNSKSSGNVARIFACTYNQTINGVTTPVIVDPVTRLPINGSTAPVTPITASTIAVSDQACKQMVRQSASPWTVENSLASAASNIKVWQTVNTTTWNVSDNLTVKNIFSYAEFRQHEDADFFGNYFPIGGISADQVTLPQQLTAFTLLTADPGSGGHVSAQSTLVEELQFQGKSSNGRLRWQAGLYYEISKPLGRSGTVNTTFTPCTDRINFVCTPSTAGQSAGAGTFVIFENHFRDQAAYAQASYDITDMLTFAAGIRYTDDKADNSFAVETLSFRPAVPGPAGTFFKCSNGEAPGFNSAATFIGYPIDQRYDQCKQRIVNSTKAPTWLAGLDFRPADNVLLYAKWSRGYRQGGVFNQSPNTLQKFGAEKVDAYEVGTKASWRGAIPGIFNLSAYYNDFRNQQLQIGVDCVPDARLTCVPFPPPTTTVANVGKSRLYGFEAELAVRPFRGMKIQADYAYINTRLNTFVDVDLSTNPIYNHTRPIVLGTPIPNAVPHKLNLSAEYTLPLPASVGRISIGGTFIYQSAYRVSADAVLGTGFGILPNASYGNINVNWNNVGGTPLDLSFFMTNVTNEVVYLHANDQSTRGFLSYSVGEPRMWGLRLRYNFGG